MLNESRFRTESLSICHILFTAPEFGTKLIFMKSAKGLDNWALGCEQFNCGEYYEAHKYWEEIWLESFGEEKNYAQGLILACGTLIHFQKNNFEAAKKLALNCQKKLGHIEQFEYRIHGLETFLKLVVEESWSQVKIQMAALRCGMKV
jgi:predicted metal-dependent hydrolase